MALPSEIKMIRRLPSYSPAPFKPSSNSLFTLYCIRIPRSSRTNGNLLRCQWRMIVKDSQKFRVVQFTSLVKSLGDSKNSRECSISSLKELISTDFNLW